MKTKSSKKKSSKLTAFVSGLKAGSYSKKGARIALTRMTNDRTFDTAEAKTAERAYKKAFG